MLLAITDSIINTSFMLKWLKFNQSVRPLATPIECPYTLLDFKFQVLIFFDRNVVKVFSVWCSFQPLPNSGLLITIKVFYFSEKISKNFRKKIHTIICLRGWDSGGIIIHSIIMVVVICYGYFKCYLFF